MISKLFLAWVDEIFSHRTWLWPRSVLAGPAWSWSVSWSHWRQCQQEEWRWSLLHWSCRRSPPPGSGCWSVAPCASMSHVLVQLVWKCYIAVQISSDGNLLLEASRSHHTLSNHLCWPGDVVMRVHCSPPSLIITYCTTLINIHLPHPLHDQRIRQIL